VLAGSLPARASATDKHERLADVGPILDLSNKKLSDIRGQDPRVTVLSYRSLALWLLGYPEAARADADLALKDAREIGQAATLTNALSLTSSTFIHCGNYAAVKAQVDELVASAMKKAPCTGRRPE
jgi:hypothetical protein